MFAFALSAFARSRLPLVGGRRLGRAGFGAGAGGEGRSATGSSFFDFGAGAGAGSGGGVGVGRGAQPRGFTVWVLQLLEQALQVVVVVVRARAAAAQSAKPFGLTGEKHGAHDAFDRIRPRDGLGGNEVKARDAKHTHSERVRAPRRTRRTSSWWQVAFLSGAEHAPLDGLCLKRADKSRISSSLQVLPPFSEFFLHAVSAAPRHWRRPAPSARAEGALSIGGLRTCCDHALLRM